MPLHRLTLTVALLASTFVNAFVGVFSIITGS